MILQRPLPIRDPTASLRIYFTMDATPHAMYVDVDDVFGGTARQGKYKIPSSTYM